MNQPTPPPSDAIAPSDAAIGQAFTQLRGTIDGVFIIEVEKVHALAAKIDRAREIAAQPGEGDGGYKGCPWCNAYTTVGYTGQPATEFFGVCTGCKATGPVRGSIEAAVEAWNARSVPSPPRVADALDGERLDWIQEQLSAKGAVWFLPCGSEYRFVQVRWPEFTKVDYYPIAEGGIRGAVDAAIASRAEAGGSGG